VLLLSDGYMRQYVGPYTSGEEAIGAMALFRRIYAASGGGTTVEVIALMAPAELRRWTSSAEARGFTLRGAGRPEFPA
jgi:hypothetical protein